MRSFFRRSAELILLAVFLSGFLITLGLIGNFWQSFSQGLARDPVPEGPFLTLQENSPERETSFLKKPNSTLSIAVWISNPNSDWRSLVAGLRRQGLPFRLAHDMKDLEAPVIVVYPTFSGRALSPQIYKHLLEKIRGGSVLITQNVESELGPRFGFQRAQYSLNESHICLDQHVAQCQDPGHRCTSLRFEKPDGEVDSFETIGYVGAKHSLATFGNGNGNAALIVNPLGKGALYAFGVDLGATVRQAQGVGLPIKPILDPKCEDLTTWIYDQIQAIYLRSGASIPLIKKSSHGKPKALITHEIRKESDLLQAVRWAALESRLGVKSIYIIDYAFLKNLTPDLWISPLPRAQLASISELGHVIALGWLGESPALDALDKGTGEESIHWTDLEGSRYQPTFPSSQTGILRISKHVLEEGYGLKGLEVFVTDQELIPGSFENALRESGFRYLIRSGFKPNGLTLPMLMPESESVAADQELTLLPSRVRVEGLRWASDNRTRSSMVILDLPLGTDAEEQIKSFYDQLNQSLIMTDLRQYQAEEHAQSGLKSHLERHMNKYEIRVESPVRLGATTIHLPAGIRKSQSLSESCPHQLEAELERGETRIELCQRGRKFHYRPNPLNQY